MKLCEFLKNRSDINLSTEWLRQNGYFPNTICSPKDWDLRHILPEIGDGNFLDMGCYGSHVIKNLTIKGVKGDMVGIDLSEPDMQLPNARYLIGDLMNVPIDSGYFDNIACLSVIEHQVDLVKFAKEASRLLKVGGRVFVTFDYWEPTIISNVKMFGLEWNPLDTKEVKRLIYECEIVGLRLVEDVDWTIQEKVITKGFWAPGDFGYTFGIVTFEKF
jgi:SAM-dependent methyltransferase